MTVRILNVAGKARKRGAAPGVPSIRQRVLLSELWTSTSANVLAFKESRREREAARVVIQSQSRPGSRVALIGNLLWVAAAGRWPSTGRRVYPRARGAAVLGQMSDRPDPHGRTDRFTGSALLDERIYVQPRGVGVVRRGLLIQALRANDSE